MPPSLPTLLLDLAGLASAALAAAQLTVIADPVLYHGPIPDEAECVDGRVSVWWEPLTGTVKFPSAAAVIDCAGPPMAAVRIRWSRCWPIEPQYVTEHSAIATELADGAWRLAATFGGCELDTSALEVMGRAGLALMQVAPRAPMGGVAAVDVVLRARPSFPGSALSTDPDEAP